MNKKMQVCSVLFSALFIAASMPVQAKVERGNSHSSTRTTVNRNDNRNVNVRSNKNVNVRTNKNVNVNVNNNGRRDGWYDDDHHPIATAAGVTAAVIVTSAVVGSIVRTVPPNCSSVFVNGVTYQQCGSTWYQPQYAGPQVQYIVVNPPR